MHVTKKIALTGDEVIDALTRYAQAKGMMLPSDRFESAQVNSPGSKTSGIDLYVISWDSSQGTPADVPRKEP
jgi:hypothetical protein